MFNISASVLDIIWHVFSMMSVNQILCAHSMSLNI
jgi:hypothetical protein